MTDQQTGYAVTVETAPALQICVACGQALPQAMIQVDASTIADVYDVWPTKRRKRVGPKVLVVELKVPA
jgi:hypothetical protein